MTGATTRRARGDTLVATGATNVPGNGGADATDGIGATRGMATAGGTGATRSPGGAVGRTDPNTDPTGPDGTPGGTSPDPTTGTAPLTDATSSATGWVTGTST